MARSLLFIHMKELTKRTRTQRPFEAEGYCETVSGACGENVRTEALQRIQGVSTVEEVVFGESHLQQVLLKTFGSPRHAYSLGSLGRQQKAPGEHASSLWEAGDCKAQLDCNGDVLSLSLSSNAHLIALSRGVLLSFQRLRVSKHSPVPRRRLISILNMKSCQRTISRWCCSGCPSAFR